jgi:hypothetical protein
VTLLGIVTLVTLLPENAQSPMVVIVSPLVVLGMVTAPPEPVYPVMVIVLSALVVYVNWACTAAGSANNSRRSSNFVA